jgi:transketolase
MHDMNYETLIQQLVLEKGRHVVMTAENRALIRNCPEVLGDRFIDTGITEQTMIGAAAGLALRGKIPIVHALACFLVMRPFEFIRTDIGIGKLNVKLSGFIPGFLSDANGPTHQALEDVSLMRGIPGMQVFAPADEMDLLQCLPKIWDSPYPSYVRINVRKGSYKHADDFEIGKAEIISEGEDITILVYGMLFEQAAIALEILKNSGLSVGLINIRSLKPIDEKAILKAARKSKLLVTIEDHFITGGLYSILAEVFLRHKITTHVFPMALHDQWFTPGLLSQVLENEGFGCHQIADSILKNYQTSINTTFTAYA